MEHGAVLGGRYQLGRLIGEGGMGAVYEGRHLVTERLVAVKILHAELAQREKARARFEREAKAAARVDHDNVCEVLDYGVDDDGTHYIVMPLLEGETLDSIIDREGQLAIERAVDITWQILSALIAAHGNGVIHRDLKPQNTFVTEVAGRRDFVKILDFGITKMKSSAEEGRSATPLTKTGSVMGTPHYMAPEQARGAKDVDGQADIYAVGAVLYEMVTGQRPIDADSYNEVLWKLWNEPLKRPSLHRPDLPRALEQVILVAMARNREKRFSTAEQFQEALGAAFEEGSSARDADVTLPTAPEDEVEGPERIAPEEDVTVPATEATLEPSGERDGGAGARRRRRAWPFLVLAVVALAGVGFVAVPFLVNEPSGGRERANVEPPREAASAPADDAGVDGDVHEGDANDGGGSTLAAVDAGLGDAGRDRADAGGVAIERVDATRSRAVKRLRRHPRRQPRRESKQRFGPIDAFGVVP